MNNEIRLHVILNPDLKDKLLELKKYTGIQHMSDLIRSLITKAHTEYSKEN